MAEKVLVTGASGCIGSWVLRVLIDRGVDFIASDLGKNTARTKLLMSADEIAEMTWAELDVTNTQAVKSLAEEEGITRIVHLAGLQIPFAKANPPLGAAVNVQGTVNIFEAARASNVKGVSYASSVAVFGPEDKYPQGRIMDDAPKLPDTLYGIFKDADEEIARVYWQDWQMPSVGLRPAVVFGVGRDQGLTSDLSKAIMALASDKPFQIRFDGTVTLQHAKDVALIFIDAALSDYQGAAVCNIRNDVLEVSEFVSMLREIEADAQIDHITGSPLPFPADLDDGNLKAILATPHHTTLKEAITEDLERYRKLVAQGVEFDLS